MRRHIALLCIFLSAVPSHVSAQAWTAALAAAYDRYEPDIWERLDYWMFHKACGDKPVRYNDTMSYVTTILGGNASVGDISSFKKWVHGSELNRNCSNAVLRHQQAFGEMLIIIQSIGGATRKAWGGSKCYNTPPYGDMSWEEAHESAVRSGQRSCDEYNYPTQQEYDDYIMSEIS